MKKVETGLILSGHILGAIKELNQKETSVELATKLVDLSGDVYKHHQEATKEFQTVLGKLGVTGDMTPQGFKPKFKDKKEQEKYLIALEKLSKEERIVTSKEVLKIKVKSVKPQLMETLNGIVKFSQL